MRSSENGCDSIDCTCESVGDREDEDDRTSATKVTVTDLVDGVGFVLA